MTTPKQVENEATSFKLTEKRAELVRHGSIDLNYKPHYDADKKQMKKEVLNETAEFRSNNEQTINHLR